MTDKLTNVAEDSARGGFFLVSGTALATVIMAIGSILIGRFLGPELYGQYTLALIIPQLLFIFTDLGINQGIIKFTASLRSEGQTDRLVKLIKHGLLLKALTGIAIFILNYTFANFFALCFLQRPDLTFYIRIASTSILFQVIYATTTSALVGLDKTQFNALATSINAIVKVIISIALVLLGFSVAGAIIGYVAGYIVAAVAGMSILFLIIHEKQSIKNDHSISDDLKTLMRYGAPLYISLLLVGFMPLYQNLMLAIFTTDADIGNYKAASNFLTLLTVLTAPITTALLPAFSKLNSSTNSKLKTFFKLANKYTTIIVIPIAVLLIILSNEVVQVIYGSKYQSASMFLATYCLLYFLMGIGYITLTSFYNGLGETKTILKMSIITFLTIIALSPILIKAYGVQGLIAAVIVASIASTMYGAQTARKKFHIEFDINSTTKIFAVSIASGIPLFLLLRMTSMSGFFGVIIGGPLYLFIYMTLIPLAGIITNSELERAAYITKKIQVLKLVANPVLKYQQKLLMGKSANT